VEQRGPAVRNFSGNTGGRGEVTRTPIRLQDLRRRIYAKAKADTSWRFWGLYVHVCKSETLHEAYTLAKKNDGAPGIDGVTFEAIEESGVDGFLDQIRDELATRRYRPMRNRRKEIPKEGGKVRVGAEIHVDDACLAPDNCLVDPVHRFMSLPVRSVADRPRGPPSRATG